MPSEDIRKNAYWDSLFDTYKVKIATFIYNIYNHITHSYLEHIIQRKEHKYDLRHQHRVSAKRFETLCEKLFLVEDPLFRIFCNHPLSAPGTTPKGQNSHALRNLNFNEESPQMDRPQIDRDFAFY